MCPTDKLDLNWQRLIFTHLLEKPHLGVLTGSPITDIKITLLAGRAHEKHTEGGDFRQATYRAVRHGLMQAESVLLEPWYRFRLEVPAQQVGRAMMDLQQMGGKVDPPETVGEETALTGTAPVAGPSGLCPGGGGLHPWTGAVVLRPGGVFPLRGGGSRHRGHGVRPGTGRGKHGGFRVLLPRGRCGDPVAGGGPARPGGQRLAPAGDGA